MNAKLAKMVEDMKKQTIGVEIEWRRSPASRPLK